MTHTTSRLDTLLSDPYLRELVGDVLHVSCQIKHLQSTSLQTPVPDFLAFLHRKASLLLDLEALIQTHLQNPTHVETTTADLLVAHLIRS